MLNRKIDPPRFDVLQPHSHLIEAGKVIRDIVLEQVPGIVAKHLEPQLKEFEGKVLVRAGGVFRKELDESDQKWDKGISDFSSAFKKQMEVEVKELTRFYERKLYEVEQAFDKKLEVMTASYEGRLEAQMKSHQMTLTSIIDLLRSLPQPQVIVPDKAILVNVDVDQKPSTVNLPREAILVNVNQSTPQVIVPEKAIRVEVEQRPSIVNIPKEAITVNMQPQKPSIVNIPEKAIRVDVRQAEAPTVILPEKAIQVNVEHKTVLDKPKRKTRVEKSIVYNAQSGRPEKIVEETTED